MPTPLIKKEAKKEHTSVQSQEKKWDKAKAVATKEYGTNNWGATTAIYEKMAKGKKK